MTLVWVIGSGGLLGSQVAAELASRRTDAVAWVPAGPRVPWADPAAARAHLAERVRAFARAVAENGQRSFAVVWAAGAGVVGTSADALEREIETLSAFVDALAGEATLRETRGAFVIASSAGGVYGACPARPICDDSPCEPVSDYGRAKLRSERVAVELGGRMPALSVAVLRFSNLYGPGQNLSKPQGLISHLSRCILHGKPAQIYVPLDTIRDYLFASDAAREVLLDVQEATRGAPTTATRIVAHGTPASIARIIGIFRRLVRRSPRFICAPKAASRLQPSVLAFRPAVVPGRPALPRTDLEIGVGIVHRSLARAFAMGLLPPPR